MANATHQTIRLSKGKHTSAEEGACVMELASMLEGGCFTDHPQSVCPVIGSFLLAYNDAIDDGHRQDLYAYAAKVVGSRRLAEIERMRAERLMAWSIEVRRRRWTQAFMPAALRALARHRPPTVDAAGTHAVRAIPNHTQATHRAALALIDELLRIGGSGADSVAVPVPARRSEDWLPTGV